MNTYKSKVKQKRLMYLRGYYLSMYRTYMLQLFDCCYISDPTVFNQLELYKNIAELGITDMFTQAGTLQLTYDQAMFAYSKAEGANKEFLLSLMNALKYRALCQSIDNAYEDCSFRDSSSSKIRVLVCQKGCQLVTKGCNEFNLAIAECLSDFSEEVKTISINEFLWCAAMRKLGVPKEEWFDDGLLDGKMSHESEVACIKGTLNGIFRVSNGKYTDRLIKWLHEHPWGSNRMSIDSKGLYDILFFDYSDEINQVVNGITNLIEKDADSKFLGMLGSTIYYSQKRSSFDMPFGAFQIINDASSEDEVILPTVCGLSGLTGEFYSVARLEADGIGYAGCPMLIESGKDCWVVYDREQTDIQFESWFSYNNVDYDFFDDSCVVAPFEDGSLPFQIYTGFINSLRDPNQMVATVAVSNHKQLMSAVREVSKFIEGVKK